ncbi:MAG: hypothetical protein Q8K55_11275 [Gemmatimonadaceae bacterium]|nr:hypothetical protein [Gemmatimonadaceae bacterium]
MRHSERVVTTVWCSVLALCSLAACHSRGASTASAPARVWPRLEALPATASIAWVLPSVLIADASSEDDASAALGSVRQMRLDVEAVLKGERWQVLDTDTAQYLATIALARRTTFQPERRAVGEASPPGRSCDATTGVCRGSSAARPQYQTVSVPVTTERVVFVITRRHDGARHVYAGGFGNAKSSGGLLAQQVITLLRAR